MNAPPPPAAGWYPDPGGKPGKKYWDGETWQLAIPAAPDAAPTAKSNSKLFLILGGLLVLVVVIALASNGRNSSTTTATTKTVTATATATETVGPTVTETVTYTPPPPPGPKTTIDTDGTYVVGSDILPGVYRTTGGEGCYWARLSSLNTSDIIDNNLSSGPQAVEIKSTDTAFLTKDCDGWQMTP